MTRLTLEEFRGQVKKYANLHCRAYIFTHHGDGQLRLVTFVSRDYDVVADGRKYTCCNSDWVFLCTDEEKDAVEADMKAKLAESRRVVKPQAWRQP